MDLYLFWMSPIISSFTLNPLTQIVRGRKLSYLGPGGLIGQTASFRYEISILVIMDAFAQLTRIKELMLDLLDH